MFIGRRAMTKKLPKDKRMKDIVRAAVDEFLEKGYEGASMEAIAKRTGISKGGLYHHFKSKDEIFFLANQKLSEPINAMMDKATQKHSAYEGLTWYIRNYLEHWQDHKNELVFYLLSFTKVLDSPVLWQMYEKYIGKVIAFFQKLYQRGIDSGEFLPHSTYDSAVVLMAALDGVISYQVISSELNLETTAALFQERFVYSLLIADHNFSKQE
jgi:AcrR family transcriptional regulator